MSPNEPLVCVLTPVYNGEKYLYACIESVLSQTYQNWEYIIVNNCSKDNTLTIANSYAAKDKRIKVKDCQEFVGVIENHNRAFQLIPKDSKYCKVVSADDWIYPDCLSKMVSLAEANPTVGVVCTYQLSDKTVKNEGLPNSVTTIDGREVCRMGFLEDLAVFGNPTSTLYLSELIRNNMPFFPHSWPYADRSAVYQHLQHCDFGFVHEVLCVERVHYGQVSTKANDVGMGRITNLDVFLKYGPVYLGESEFENHKTKVLEDYWKWLGGCILKLKGKEFWKFQSSRLEEFGHPIPWLKVIKGATDEIFDELHNPIEAINKFHRALKDKFNNIGKG